MDAFLLVARCGKDDVPVSLHATRADAEAEARRVDAMPAGGLAEVREAAQTVFGLHVHTEDYIGLDVVEFRGGRVVETDPLEPGGM